MTPHPMGKYTPAAVPSTTTADLYQAAQGGSTAPPLSSAAVLRGQKSVSIEHQGVIYRLQVTKLGKLILTK